MDESKELTAKLVHKTEFQRIYELNQVLTKGCTRLSEDIKRAIIEDKKRTNPKYKDCVMEDGAHFICVSDARTHFERLVFVAADFGTFYSRIGVKIDGALTFMTHGGDKSSVKPDEVYIRRLAMANGFVYKGIINQSCNGNKE